MKIEKRLFVDQWIITIDGKEYSQEGASVKLKLPVNEIIKACVNKSDENFGTHLIDLQWRLKNGAGFYENIYEKDGKRITTSILRKLSGVGPSLAATNIVRWLQGKLTYNEMINYDSADYNSSRSHCIGSVPLKKMQPRKETWELKGAGTWEKENCKSDTFSKIGRPTVCGHSSKGVNLRGD
jgi:hypothetical protein